MNSRQRALTNNLAVTAGAVLLLALPLSGVCQIESVQAEESSEPIEEIVVQGRKSLVNLKREMYKAEGELYALFNSFILIEINLISLP